MISCRRKGFLNVRAVRKASGVAAHLIAYAEMRRMKRLLEPEAARIRGAFEADWKDMTVITPTEPMVRRAGELAEQFSLRAYDSMHLSAAEMLLLSQVNPQFLRFACFDRNLNSAARSIGLGLMDLR